MNMSLFLPLSGKKNSVIGLTWVLPKPVEFLILHYIHKLLGLHLGNCSGFRKDDKPLIRLKYSNFIF